MKEQSVETHTVTIWMAGAVDRVLQVLRDHCYENGACFTVTETTFVYTGGEERGVSIGLVNYPRFPTTAPALWALAQALVQKLLPACNQRTALLVTPTRSTWMVVEPPGSTEIDRSGSAVQP